MTALIKTQTQLVEQIAATNELAAVVATRMLNVFNRSVKTFSNHELAQLAALCDAEMSIKLGIKLAEAQVFIEPEVLNQSKKKSQGEAFFLKALEQHGGGYDTSGVATIFGNITATAVGKKRKNHQLFFLKVAGKYYHPKFQFDNHHKITKPFRDILAILGTKDQMAGFQLLTSTLEVNNGKTLPIYEILKGEKQPRYVYEQIEKLARRIDSLCG